MPRYRLLLAGLLLCLSGAGGWYLFGSAPEYPAAEPRLSVGRALGGDVAGFARADRQREFRFPDDHGPHPAYRTEWWYYTGNLQSAAGRHFGFQLTFFRTALTAPHGQPERASAWGTRDVSMAHFAVSDVAAGQFHVFQRFSRVALGLAGASARPFRVWLEDWSVAEDTAQPLSMRLSAEENEVGLQLVLTPAKPIVLHGDKGLSQKGVGPGNASYYYSLTRLRSAGVLRIGAEEFQVQGLSWMDREWGTSVLSEDVRGWDWFALQLSNGQEVMLYQVRRTAGDIHPLSSGSLVRADGTTRALTLADFQIDVLQTWQSPVDGTIYPSQWRLRIPSEAIDLTITPYLADQEMLTVIRYWEGAVRAQGTIQGQILEGDGYVELTGYAEKRAAPDIFGRMQ